MDYIPSEMLRGHLDTIILLSLIDSDKNSNQIKEVIEKRSDGQFVLKQGTFYSCLQRIVKQGYVTEYRTTDETDGTRRKFFQLTEKGKTYIDENKDSWEFSKHILDMLIAPEPKKEEFKEEKHEEKEQKKSVVKETDNDDLKAFLRERIDNDPKKLAENDVSYIDYTQAETVFTATENPEKTKYQADFEQLEFEESKQFTAEMGEKTEKDIVEQPRKKEPFVEPVVIKEEISAPAQEPNVETVAEEPKKTQEKDVNDSFELAQNVDYKSVLEKIFPYQKTVSRPKEMAYEEGVDINKFFADEPPKAPPQKLSQKRVIPRKAVRVERETQVKEEKRSSYIEEDEKTGKFYDFSDVYDLANEEGFKIRVSSKENKQDIGRILINKLNFFASLIFFCIIFVETIIMYLSTSATAKLDFLPYFLFLLICFTFPLYNGIFFIIAPSRKIRSFPQFKNSMELIIIICLNFLLIDIVCCILAAIDFSSPTDLTRYLFYPILFIVTLPAYEVIKYLLLQQNRFYE